MSSSVSAAAVGALLLGALLWAAHACFHSERSTMGMIARGMAYHWRHDKRLMAFMHRLHAARTLSGMTVLVTGSRRGLGLGIAAHLAAAGARLVLPLRDGDDEEAVRAARVALAAAANAVRGECGARGEGGAALAATDIDVVDTRCVLELGDLGSIERYVASLRAAGVELDAVVNNAGMVPIRPELTADGFEPAFGVNFIGTAHLTQRLLSSRVLRRAGRVVNVSSEEHRLGSFADHILLIPQAPGRRYDARDARRFGATPLGAVPPGRSVMDAMARYAYSKLLLTTYSIELSRQHRGLSVVDVCPGPVASEIARHAPWPLNAIVREALRLVFPSAARAALAVVELAIQPRELIQPVGLSSEARPTHYRPVHFHMSEHRAASSEAAEPAIGQWLWDETQMLIAARRPPGAAGRGAEKPKEPRRARSKSPPLTPRRGGSPARRRGASPAR